LKKAAGKTVRSIVKLLIIGIARPRDELTVMFILEFTLKGPTTLSIQKKEQAEAESAFQMLVSALKGDNDGLIELTCDHQTNKKVALLGSSVLSVQMYEKTSGGAGGRAPGFFAPNA
jgi:hypothetical protein